MDISRRRVARQSFDRSAKKTHDHVFAWSDIKRTVVTRRPPRETENKLLPLNKEECARQVPPSPHVLEVLRGISGKAVSSELVAIVGPSGAGKSCFLDVLACRKTVGTLSGHCTFNGRTVSRSFMGTASSYVTQEDTFHPTQTVLEVVVFQAQLRLDSRIPYSKKVYMARALVSTAGLASKENLRVGGTLPGGITIRGLSGGEKRRLSMCCGTITQPEILFADEPTSGLDSLAALMIIRLLRDFCSDRGMIVFTTIHQPRQDIWNLFDKVLVLAKGYQIFYGSPVEADTWFSTTLNLARPPTTPPSDFILDQVNIDFDKTGLYVGEMATATFTTMEDLAKASSLYMTKHVDGTAAFGMSEQEDTVSIVVPDSCLDRERSEVPDFVFLSHSMSVSSFFSHLFPPTEDGPFEMSWWMRLLSPFVTFLFFCAPIAQWLKLRPFLLAERFYFYREGSRERGALYIQVWITTYAGWQYPPGSFYVKFVRKQINEVVRWADQQKIPYLGLGALNKAEWLNCGGSNIQAAVRPQITKIMHGYSMTAAAVCGNIIQIVEAKDLDHTVFLTGVMSKVGRAVALSLADRGFDVVCYTASPQRFAEIQAELPATATGKLTCTERLEDGGDIMVWVHGEYLPAVNQHMPEGAVAVTFSLRNPIDESARPDVLITDGAVFELPEGSYSRHGSPLPSSSTKRIDACLAGGLVHAYRGGGHDELGEIDWTSLDRHLAEAHSLKLRLPAIDHGMMRRRPPSWLFQYSVLLRRNFHSYVRSLGNVLARLVVVATVSVIAGTVYLGVGRSNRPEALNDIVGALFFCCFALCLLPYAAQSTFLYDRRFFQGEKASGLYSCSAYYLATMTLEGLLNAVNGLIFGTIMYWMVAYHDFVHPEDPASCALGFIGILVLLNLVANSQIMFTTFASPNQEVAFVVAAAYTAIAFLGAGVFVAFPSIFIGARFVQYLSMVKYPYQAILLSFFKDNPRALTPFGVPVEQVLNKLEFNTPSTVGANLAVAVAMYIIFNFLGFLCLRYLYKERR